MTTTRAEKVVDDCCSAATDIIQEGAEKAADPEDPDDADDVWYNPLDWFD